MKIFKLFIMLIIVSCSNSPFRKISSDDKADKLEALNRRILGLNQYFKRSMEWRRDSLLSYSKMMEYHSSTNGVFHQNDLKVMHDGAVKYVKKLRNPVYEMLNGKNFSMNFNDKIVIINSGKSFIEKNLVRAKFAVGGQAKSFDNLKNKTYTTKHGKEFHNKIFYNLYHLNPNDAQGEIYLKEMKIALASALMLLDNFKVINYYLGNKTLRRSLFYDMPDIHKDVGITMKQIWYNYTNYSNSKVITETIAIYKQFKSKFKAVDDFDNSLNDLIESTTTYQRIESGSKLSWYNHIKMEIKRYFQKGADKRKLFLNRTTNQLSKHFGNTMGKFQSRSGKLKSMDTKALHDLESRLKPLDILLEKTPFRLTDKFIPGHYGHVAIWVGNEQELINLGVWKELPKLYQAARKHYGYNGPSFQSSIQSGHKIIEALRPGVQINTLHHFMDIDDFASLSIKTCEQNPEYKNCVTNDQQKNYLIEAFKQIGKEYDFNFDVNTEKTIVCSELAYRSYLDINWETSKTLGKNAISPDQVAVQADNIEDPFYPSIIIFNGKEVKKDNNDLYNIFNLLINTNYDKVEAVTGICKSYKEKECH